MNKRKKDSSTIWLFFLGICLSVVLGSGCTSTTQNRVNASAEEVFNTLYTPEDVSLIGIVERDDALVYARGCTGVLLDIAYGTNRKLTEVLKEYEVNLIESGWELRPGYIQKEDAKFFQKGPMLNLFIGDSVTAVDVANVNYLTIYVLTITYTEPSNYDCVG